MWTEHAVETLIRMALEGKSAASIAAVLGGPSRNAVIGKATRIGIKLNGGMRSALGEPGPRAEQLSPTETAWRWPRSARFGETTRPERPSPKEIPWRSRVSHAANRATAVRQERKRADRSIFATAEVGEMRRIGLPDISEVHCRWPLGDPTEEDFVYCGLQVARGHSYCAGHCRLAYRLPSAEGRKED